MGQKSFAIIYLFVFLVVVLVTIFFSRTDSIGQSMRHSTSPSQNSIFLTCQNKTYPYERLRCLIPYFEKLTRNGSVSEAVTEAKKLQQEKIIDDCHLAAHMIGQGNLRKNNYDIGKAFATCAPGCIEGCYHGVMEEYLSQNRDINVLLNQVPHFCESVSHDWKLRRQCLHGVGHGLLHHNDISLVEAVKLCRSFGNASSQDTCIGGVFMQNINNIMLSDEKTFRSKLAGMCAPIDFFHDQTLKNYCVEHVGEGITFYTGHDLRKSQEFCLELLPDDRNHCSNGVEDELMTNKFETAQ